MEIEIMIAGTTVRTIQGLSLPPPSPLHHTECMNNQSDAYLYSLNIVEW